VASEWDAQAEWRALAPCVRDPPPLPQEFVPDNGRVAGEWDAIDGVSVLACILSPCGHISDVPSHVRVDWARARAEVLQEITRAGELRDSVALERGLKWHLCLHDVLLRAPRRGTRGGARTAGVLESRFTAWREGAREGLLQWWQDDSRRASVGLGGRTTGGAAALVASDDERELRQADVALQLIREGELSRALRALHSLGAAGITSSVLEQLRRKHPPSAMHVPAVLPGLQPSRISVALTDTFRQLRRHIASYYV